MSKVSRKAWTDNQLKQLAILIQDHSAEEIADMMKRSVNAIVLKASREGLVPKDKAKQFYPKKHIKPKKIRGTLATWRQHPVHKNYYVTDTGLVWNARNGKYQSIFEKNNGHVVTKIAGDKGSKELKVSKLVAETWLNLREGQSVVHKDRNKRNNDIANLLVLDKSRAGKATGHLSKAKKVALYVNDKPVKVYRSVRQAAIQNNLSYQTILDSIAVKYENPRHGKDFRFYTPPPRQKK